MKSTTRCLSLLAPLFYAAMLLNGCASISMGRTASSSATLQAVADDYRQARLQTAATEESLEGLAIAPDPDLSQSYYYFSQQRDKMEQIGSRLIAHADGMFLRGTYYFVESGKSLEACAFPRVGKTEDQHGIDLGQDFAVISQAGGEIKRAFRAFQVDIEQIQGFLANNLTPNGVDSIEPILRKAKVDSESLQDALRQALSALEHAKTTLSQTIPPPPSTSPTEKTLQR
jgi:hypothetical protein